MDISALAAIFLLFVSAIAENQRKKTRKHKA